LVITNGHVVQPAYEPPRWLVNQIYRAVTIACMEAALKERRGSSPVTGPTRRDALKRKLLDRGPAHGQGDCEAGDLRRSSRAERGSRPK
jgi:hypothetical protein